MESTILLNDYREAVEEMGRQPTDEEQKLLGKHWKRSLVHSTFIAKPCR